MQNTIKRIIAVISILIIPIGILLFRSQISAQGMTRNEAIVATVAGIIGMIPEGLVLLTSISFILGVGRLAKKAGTRAGDGSNRSTGTRQRALP